jgi:hypothetical protein
MIIRGRIQPTWRGVSHCKSAGSAFAGSSPARPTCDQRPGVISHARPDVFFLPSVVYYFHATHRHWIRDGSTCSKQVLSGEIPESVSGDGSFSGADSEEGGT